ncbi:MULTISPECIES: hypothetical protein [unclassified Streptomyces]|uniref:hypothetical protein n=1 Tax=unclassified Streptomyces TaxID=2593676 RepID=UPI002E15E366|nr:hypothetical protein OG452_15200 [Streptomyces sp. NBC_01197]WSS50742.1 hypothetical protein OG708_20195 [Streptomyces sp. NBC_01180]
MEIEVCGVVFAVAVLGLIGFGFPYLKQAPLRKRGVKTWAWEASKSVPQDGKITVRYGYDGRDGGLHSIARVGLTAMPSGSQEVVYDPENPKRAEFVSLMPENVSRRRNLLLILMVVALASLVLGCVSTLM